MSAAELLPVTRIPRTGLPPRAVVVGDPFRAERLAQRLEDPVEVAHAREYRTFRGSWQGVELVVSSHGVGGPGAICLFQELADAGIGTILRLGTAGAMQAGIGDGDLVIAEACVRDDGVTQQLVPPEYPAVSSPELVLTLEAAARERNAPHHRGLVWTRAAFYPGLLRVPMPAYVKAGVLAIEMELSALLVHGSLNGLMTGGVLVVDGVAADELRESTGYDPHRDVVAAGVERGMDVALDALVRVS
ncbi:MAG: uridine phosphorylase [Blastococcus sp.]|jgi:uridine phosphorylase|nr:uridine phosphorylase [Blastococcus sp.]